MKRLARKIKRRLKAMLKPAPHAKILEEYVSAAPAPQLALDIFKGEWASKLPPPLDQLQAGTAGLFQDERIIWGLSHFGGVQGLDILELGPLEAGHTYMLEQAGAAAITAIEANTRAYLKCLIIKELFRLSKAQFLCGDFVEYLRANKKQYDLCLASGVLYHMRNPVELIALLARTSKRALVWTHYYDPQRAQQDPAFGARFQDATAGEYGGFRHSLYKQHYHIDRPGFCGGNAPFSCWMRRDEILAAFKHFGFEEIQTTLEDPGHPNGPCVTFAASRRP